MRRIYWNLARLSIIGTASLMGFAASVHQVAAQLPGGTN